VARAIHHAGRRAARPFLVLDCSVHSAESFERELFGEAPSGDGIVQQAETVGRLASGAGGTLLLENIQMLPITAQKKLASILTRKSFLNPATNTPRPLEIRVMASTQVGREPHDHRLQSGLEAAFGQCLVRVPPLRQRRQDISLLVESILNRLAVAEGKSMKRLTVEALKILQAHGWPGNMSELETVVERACALDDNDQLTADMLRPWIARVQDESHGTSGLSLRDMERKLIETTFARCRGNREQTARMLQIGIRTLSGKLREYGYPPRGGPGSNRRLAGAA
jgi:DNA-binding NtrC family response regulator